MATRSTSCFAPSETTLGIGHPSNAPSTCTAPEKTTIDKSGANTAGIESMHMIRKGQLGAIKDQTSSPTNQFYSLAF